MNFLLLLGLIDRIYGRDWIIRASDWNKGRLYLAEKFGHFIPEDLSTRTAMFNWLFWQMGSAPFLGGGFGHFYAYAPEKLEKGQRNRKYEGLELHHPNPAKNHATIAPT